MWAMQLLGHQVQKNTDMKNRIKSLRIHFLGANLTHSLPSWLPFSLLVHYCGLPPSLMTIFDLIWQSLMTKWSKCPKAELLRNDASEKCDLSGFYWSGVLYWSSLYGNEKAIGSVFGQPCCLTGVWRGWSESDVNSLIWANVHCMTWFL